MIHVLPPHVSAKGRSWPVYRTPDRSHPGGDGLLIVNLDGVRFSETAGETVRIQRADIAGAAVDGECLRLSFGDRELLLMPVGGPDNPAWRARQSAMIASRVLQAPAR